MFFSPNCAGSDCIGLGCAGSDSVGPDCAGLIEPVPVLEMLL